MDRRTALKQLMLIMGVSSALPASALDLGKALSAAKSLGQSASINDNDIKNYFSLMSKEYDAQNQVAPESDPYAKRLATLTHGLNTYDGQDFNYKVYLTSDVNAFAMGDGTVRVYSGLMDLMTDDEVRYVIGHEMGHVKSGHSKARMKTALNTSALRDIASAAGGTAQQLSSSELGNLVENVIKAQHSQGNEREADDYAMAFLKKNKYTPMAAVTALEKLDKLSGGGGGGWTATHPAPAERAKRMRAQMA